MALSDYKIRVKYDRATEFKHYLKSRQLPFYSQEIYFMETHLEAVDFFLYISEEEALVANLKFQVTLEKLPENSSQIWKSKLEI